MRIKGMFGKIGIKAKKNSPEILLASGIVCGVASTVLACKATLKLQEINEFKDEYLEKMDKTLEEKREDYTEADAAQDFKTLKIKTAGQIVKEYAPAVSVGLLGISCTLASYKIIKTRSAAYLAAYEAINKAFKKYRENVVEKYGKEEDQRLYRGRKMSKVDSKKMKIDETDKNYQDASPYAVTMNRNHHNFSTDNALNEAMINSKILFAEKKLHASGHLFLNEVYDMLGVPHTKEGSVCGWVIGNGGDEFISFGIIDPITGQPTEEWVNFLNGVTNDITFDFNVDGPIWDLI